MRNIVIALIAVFILGSCSKNPEVSTAVNKEFNVDRLFTFEGCSMYRFSDNGDYIYYSNCGGQTQWNESCGKACTRTNRVSTSVPTEPPKKEPRVVNGFIQPE